MKTIENGRKIRHKITQEVEQDLFTVPTDYSLAHCVAKDLEMRKGIALVFRRKYGRIGELTRQVPTVGKVLTLSHEGRRLFYLVTKEWSSGKPSYENLWRTLCHLRDL